MKRWYLCLLPQKLGAVYGEQIFRRYATSTNAAAKKATRVADTTNATTTLPDLSSPPTKPHLPLRVLGTLLNGSKRPIAKPQKNHGRWSLRDYTRRVNGLVAAMPLESAVSAVTYVVSSPSVPDRLRARVLAKASYSFLRHDCFAGALAMYKLLLSQRFTPPLSLVASMYRAANVRGAHKAAAKPKDSTNLTIPSIVSMDDRLLALLLSALELSGRPEVMESIVERHATQISASCLKDASVVASMIRGYHVAGQLDGCYAWFYRYRNSLSTKRERTPATPYVCLMAASRKLDPKNTKSLYRIIKMIQEDDIPLTRLAYNEILASELYNRNFKRIFSLFLAFRDTQPSLRPDAYTFSLVFDALWKNETGPGHAPSLHPHHVLRQMLYTSVSNPSILNAFNCNAALRYFTHIGDFRSSIAVIDAALSARVSPNTLTIRWVLEEILKRCQGAFTSTSSFELENWTKAFLGGLTRDHLAHTSHLLDIIRSTRTDNESHKLTRIAQDALRLVHNSIVPGRSLALFATEQELQETPVFSMVRDILYVCSDPA